MYSAKIVNRQLFQICLTNVDSKKLQPVRKVSRQPIRQQQQFGYSLTSAASQEPSRYCLLFEPDSKRIVANDAFNTSLSVSVHLYPTLFFSVRLCLSFSALSVSILLYPSLS